MVSYTKLRDGDWGLRAFGEPLHEGERVCVMKKSGESKMESVGKVIWKGGGVIIATIEREEERSTYIHPANRRFYGIHDNDDDNNERPW